MINTWQTPRQTASISKPFVNFILVSIPVDTVSILVICFVMVAAASAAAPLPAAPVQEAGKSPAEVFLQRY